MNYEIANLALKKFNITDNKVSIFLKMFGRSNFKETLIENNEFTNLASLAFSLFKNNYFSFLIHFWTFSLSTFQPSVFQLALLNFYFRISRKNYFVLLKRKLYRKNLSFLRGRIKSSQKRGKHVLAAILPILHLVAVLWKMKDCWLLLCKDLYLEFLALFYFAYEKDRQSYSYTDILNPI